MDAIMAGVVIGAGATAVFDLWGIAVARGRGVPRPAWKMPGRWFAHLPRGRFVHADLGAAEEIRGESAIGWVMHYLVGISFGLITVAWGGADWLAAPTPGIPMVVGLATVLLGWLVMQPGMGLGIGAAKTPAPWTVRGLGLAAHAVFGLAMYLIALMLA